MDGSGLYSEAAAAAAAATASDRMTFSVCFVSSVL